MQRNSAQTSKLVAPVFKLVAMHDGMEGTEAAADLASLFYTGDSTAAQKRDVERIQGPGPLRRAKGASSPTKKMAATPYGHQVNRVSCWPNSLSTRL